MGDFIGDMQIRRVQIDVKGHQRHPRADGRHARGGMNGVRTEVRPPQGISHFLRHPFKLALADGGQILPVGRGGGLFI
ncbi:hypothetical protein SDC9_113599 [bioreactor metagenome]|uniref:Uncharacterized protein n=1 Tax=bioreactor metagenome TaxID=1076179 RepID=A0A645BMJ0_9ZZZZ